MVDQQVVWFLTGSQGLYGDDVLVSELLAAGLRVG